MTLTESLTQILKDFNKNHKAWIANQNRYNQTIWHSLLSTIMEEGIRFFNEGIKASQDLVKLLKRQEAFENHGLEEGEYSYPEQLQAAIKNNELQFNEALKTNVTQIPMS